jgi:asparagine synthase (glutamine-hydrolysing)
VCGICGIVAFGRPAEAGVVADMARLLEHRGPDGKGSFAAADVALGARRLAIIDLSSAGDQPFASDDGTLQLIHNGEIYNYRELRRELESNGHRFRSATDTEVILAAYADWGTRCVERFNGMWAFALWDSRHRRLFCSRDRFGVKPFYYRFDGRRFVFASELKAFAADPATRLAPNPTAVREYLEQAYADHTDETFFVGIRRLPAAHSLTVDADGLRIVRYWELEPREPPADAASALRQLFLDSVGLRLRSDVPVGTALSGGLDSSAIAVAVDHLFRSDAASAASRGTRQPTFTVYFDVPGFDERPYARAVVEKAAAEPHWITFGADDLVADLPAIVRAQDEPFGSTSIAAGWYVMRAAGQAGVRVMLDGQGGDEVLAGYRALLGFHLADLLAERRLRRLGSEVAAFRDMHGAFALLTAVSRPFASEGLTRRVRSRVRAGGALVHPELRAGATPAALDGAGFSTRLRRHQQLMVTRRGLPELLRYEDRNSMAHSVEARVPFLDYRLVELAFSFASDELIRGGRTKDVLRRALVDLLPPAVVDRRDKLGFVTPERQWLRGRLGELAADVFASRSFAERGFVSAAAARKRLDRHRRGDIDAGMELWRALNLELWAREFIDRP